MNAIAVPAVKKKIVVIGDAEGYRRTMRLTEEKRELYRRALAVLDLHRMSGLKIVVIVPIIGPGAQLATHIANHFGANLVECPSLESCTCAAEMGEVCECLQEYATDPHYGLMSLVVPTHSAWTVTDALVGIFKRPKKNLIEEHVAPALPLYVF
ncbi:MAG TPA: hypothetical protein VFP46_00265 [Candidatus Paceibacterota bacterium]|nr:hypothetical protein [Candidatus Paceibacterota bacterium]